MLMEEQLIVFSHCCKLLVRNIPNVCYKCNKTVKGSFTPPFYYPSPFVDAHRTEKSFSVILKPSDGNWTMACNPYSDLHVGITDGNEQVLSYWWSGVTSEKVGWGSCLCLYSVSEADVPQWEGLWKDSLIDMRTDFEWSQDKYDESLHNCYDFVLEFLSRFFEGVKQKYGQPENLGRLGTILQKKNSKKERCLMFTEAFVGSKMEDAIQYLSLVGEIEKNQYACLD